MNSIEDTITAIATPIGEGGISVVRISGNRAIEVVDKCFHGKSMLRDVHTHTVHFGKISGSETMVIDEVVATVFRAPNSYTGEDVVEIACHGSIFVVEQIIHELLHHGARLAEPGEFTKRAFLNGRIDLSQAEAVADLIHSRTQISHRVALSQLQGSISKKIQELRNRLIEFCGSLEIELDFSEEGLEFFSRQMFIKELEHIIDVIDHLTDSFKSSKAIREGINVTIVGKTNVGKSSIFNYLVADSRAIVTKIPGTTRDIIKESINIDGILFTLADTAGFRNSLNEIEMEGMRRSMDAIKIADIIIFVTDIQERDENKHNKILEEILQEKREDAQTIFVKNKIDLLPGNQVVKGPVKPSQILLSAKTGIGIKALENELFRLAAETNISNNDRNPIVINARHLACLQKAYKRLFAAKTSIENNMSNEFITIDVRGAINSLGEITGTISNEDVLNSIFTKFCVGK